MTLVHVRRMLPEDAATAADLCAQLGYPSSAAEMQARMSAFASRDTEVAFVALGEDRAILGWIHASARVSLESGAWVEIGGLVVDRARRSGGIGKALLTAAERWAREQGCRVVRVRSRVEREAAHRFYEREGFVRVKTQQVYEKAL